MLHFNFTQALTPDPEQKFSYGNVSLGAHVTPLQGFGVEFMLTFVLIIIIFAATDEHRTDLKGSAPVAIGLCLAALVLYGVSGQWIQKCM
jgi:glycerol uptake facilitator-like aquaporin